MNYSGVDSGATPSRERGHTSPLEREGRVTLYLNVESKGETVSALTHAQRTSAPALPALTPAFR